MRQAIFTAIMLLALSFTAQAATPPFRLDKSNDEVLQSLIASKAAKFTVRAYSDNEKYHSFITWEEDRVGGLKK
ncbi:MAG: hypothetical protein IJS28_06095 [Synergistaceae bacterium]|nr:hypothetical protein [Synergistaceae bacterium]